MSFLKALLNKKNIYGEILLHLYDTSTDIGVLVQWAILAKREAEDENFDVKTLDMRALFWTSLSFLILYRIISAVVGYYSAKSDERDFSGWESWDIFLGLIDMYVIKAVLFAIKQDAEEPTAKQRMIQLMESIFESLPQIVLQSVFIVRSQNDPVLSTESSWLIGLSLLGSLWSISSKYIYADKYGVIEAAEEAKFSLKKPCINGLYMLRVVWRFSLVAVRFLVCSLVWTALGGVIMCLFVPSSFALWLALSSIEIYKIQGASTSNQKADNVILSVIAFSLIALVSPPSYKSRLFAIGHIVETLLALSIITWFAFDVSVSCPMCSLRVQSQARRNGYIFGFLFAAWLAVTIDLITYLLMLCRGVFKDAGNGTFLDVFGLGIRERVRTVEEQANFEIEEKLRMHIAPTKHLLLFGSPNSWKTAIFEKIIGTEYKKSRIHVHAVREQCVSAMLCLLSQELYDEDAKSNEDTEDVAEAIQYVASLRGHTFDEQMDAHHDQNDLDKLAQCLKSLWRLDAVQAVYAKCESRLGELENMRYFFEQVERIFDADYEVSDADYLQSRVRERSSCIECKTVEKKWEILCLPSRDSRWNRKRIQFINRGRSVHPIFVIPLSDYSVWSDGMNAMHVAIQSFKDICSCREIKEAGTTGTVLVFLTKNDVFRERLRAQIPLSVCFEASAGWDGEPWNGPNYCPIDTDVEDDKHFEDCYQAAIEFIRSAFVVNSFKKRLNLRVISLSDVDKIHDGLFYDLQHVVLTGNIGGGGIL
eukprot:CAMPEP_0202699404 /NCGR_PEP_ID=MMETSP1385-20130828/12623_1 /ASSEMBLY_ACC=CAM_ASM_000861 /TAXON_ID=933848 /ORGANISM="Elphidium margaritaceum" /LENGTH=760 /DNA_ID=CAMNT_0049356339 /DNA_START=146 /DNA_END=2428 /DNA_ORIENTATION=-